ncbi:hypothetical protein GOP47_0011884 [Adiantum capillus-veneris]|uniref:Late embryogenesis abundant protein n=1 Tax=Adiantum capillus-veneris TaxID=13818 RepID=A0A9D4ZI82_ADICA|nr:hypothetical protein GOP47_0011884 [Adiantum capillus-veneris]
MADCTRRALGFVIGASRRALGSQRALSWARGREVFFSSAAEDYKSEVDEINSKFAEARDEIEMAMESKETVYFDEEARTAREAVQLVLNKYQTLVAKLPDPDKGSVQRSMGLKMEQLKAELDQLNA